MTSADGLAKAAFRGNTPPEIPSQVKEVVERHRQALFSLADSLLAAGHDEEVVVQILDQASQSFSSSLKSKLEGLSL